MTVKSASAHYAHITMKEVNKMNDCIYRSAAINALWKLRKQYQLLDDTQTADKIMQGLYSAEQVINDVPSADVEPVRHGKWIKNEELSSNHVEPIFLCSNCNYFEAWGFPECYPYCPYCGARMDGDENADEITE